MIALAALTVALSLNAQPSTLQLQEPALQVPAAPAPTLGVDTHLAPHAAPNLHPNLEKVATAGALVIGGLGCVALAAAVGLVVVGAVLVVWVAAEVLVAMGKGFSALGGVNSSGGPSFGGGASTSGGYSGSL